MNNFKEGHAAVKRRGKWGYIDDEGKMIVSCQYDEVRDYSEELAAVNKGRLWGFVDKRGETVTPYEDYVRVAMKVNEKRCYGAIQLKEK